MMIIWRTFLCLLSFSLVQSSLFSSPDADVSNGIDKLMMENKNRIRSKHLEMWDIIIAILERKSILQQISNQRFFLPEKLFEDDSTSKFKSGKCCNGDNTDKLDRTKLNYIQQYYNFNVEMCTFLLNELKALSQLERECQALV